MRTGRAPRRHRANKRTDDACDPAADFYTVHYRAYHAETFNIDPTPFLGPFARRLPPGSRVLDVGCGSGRDLVWLRRQGFEAIGFERSPGLAELARQAAGGTVIVGDFTRFDFTALAVDALVLCSALVHVPPAELAAVLGRILPAVRPQNASALGARDGVAGHAGLVYVSLKEGRGQYTDAWGRRFYLWSDTAARRLFEALSLAVVHFRSGLSAVADNSAWLGYVLSLDRCTDNYQEYSPDEKP
ncbi:MAG: methyltransferase domain-containing protein [Desulfobacterales bacterium]|nr:methyltransferase domain-containing protein [Desulfobacterales bacterium]